MSKQKIKIGEDGIYDAKKLGLPRMLLLGLQHAFAMFGATVLVPILTGLSISTTLLMAGLGTLLFHIISKGKVPAFLGSSFAFIGGYAAVAPFLGEKDANGILIESTKYSNLEMLPYACGGVFVAGLVYLVLSAFIKFFGVKRVMKFFPPVVTGPIIISIGLILAPIAINSCNTDWLLALIAIGVIIICNIFGKGMVKIVPIMLGIFVSYMIALILGRVDFTSVNNADVFGLPLQSSAFMKFKVSAIISIVPIALATMMEHIGDISAISATTGKNYLQTPGLHRTLLGDGLATSLSAAFGGPANTTYGENTGVLALTKVYDPKVMQIAACFAVVLSFFPKFSAIINTIPAAIVGGTSLILYGMISSIGIRNVVENHVDFTKSRNLIIAAVILGCALGFNGSANGALVLTIGDRVMEFSGLAVAAIVGILLNALLPGNDYVFKTEDKPD
jgi:uracil permease